VAPLGRGPKARLPEWIVPDRESTLKGTFFNPLRRSDAPALRLAPSHPPKPLPRLDSSLLDEYFTDVRRNHVKSSEKELNNMSEQTMEFKAEVKQVLDLMIHSLYTHKEVFLRELISNASDAIDRARYESLTNTDLAEGDGDWKIRITADKAAGTLTVSDNGIGMTMEEIVEALGTIAHSGTKDFLIALQQKDIKDNPELIGQFGVGFYASFMVADKITVISRKAGLPASKGVRWESVGEGSYTVTEAEKEGKGTDVILHLREEEKQYLQEWEIRSVVKKYSDFIEHPIVMEVEKEEESTLKKGERVKVREDEVLNSQKALWLRDKADISKEEYTEFYHHVSHDFSEPLKVVHFKAEGISEFAAVLFIPAHAPLNIFYKDYKIGPRLYVKRVQIMEHCEELVPAYLRFVRGVVDSSDLPLNVSRELLQKNRQVEIIRNNITKKILDTLDEMKKDDMEAYLTFHEQFAKVLKEGIHFDFARREAIADLLLFRSTLSLDGKLRSLADYVADMKEDQKEIYFITGSTIDDVKSSPYLEAFRKKGYEVLFLLDEIDDFLFSSFEYKGKHLKSVLRGEIDLGSTEAADKEKAAREYAKLIDLIKETLKDEVQDVRLSGRLIDSPCCLVAEEGAMDSHMEKILKAMGQEVPEVKRILEINPDHPLFAAMNGVFEKDKGSPLLMDYIGLLYDQALILEGSRPKDPSAFVQRLAKLMVEGTKTVDSR
jgi:molecular chaperone HtpG